MTNQMCMAQGTKYEVLPNFWDLLQGVRRGGGVEICKFLRMRAQFLLCRFLHKISHFDGKEWKECQVNV